MQRESLLSPASLLGYALALGTAALAGLGVPRGIWMACGVLAATSAVAGYVVHRRVHRFEQVRSECQRVARSISEFVGDRRRDDPLQTGVAEGRQVVRYHTETLARYGERFSFEALEAFDRAAHLGLVVPARRSVLEHPTNLLGIEEVGQILGAIGRKS